MKLIFWLRSLFATAVFVVLTALAAVAVVFSGVVRRTRWIDFVLRSFWARSTLFFYNVKLHVSGQEHLPVGGCLFIFNHASDFDILAITAAIEKSARFGAKAELFKIPLFAAGMRAAGVLPIHRADRERVFQLYAASVKKVHDGQSYILAAEGTRQPVPGVGARFKAGPFVFAVTGQVPMVPIVVRGAAECLPRGRLIACVDRWRHDIYIQILPPVSTKGLHVDDRDALQDGIRRDMTATYASLGRQCQLN